MQIVRSVSSMQALALRWKRQGVHVGFVPTMGYLHAGHLSLVRRARKLAGRKGKVVLSIYVNPTQFGPREDFANYPRDFKRDVSLCEKERVDVVFAPVDKQMYPPNQFSTFVVEEKLSLGMEGKSRPGHFRGVTTVVAKLFNILQPTVAVFGAKDYQQAAVVKQMVKDLNFPIQIEVAPICREADGLAMSSRNRYLDSSLRAQALVLSRAMQQVRSMVKDSRKPLSSQTLKSAVQGLVQSEPDARLDYIEFFDPKTLGPAGTATRGTHMALAVFIGKTRLIDNGRI